MCTCIHVHVHMYTCTCIHVLHVFCFAHFYLLGTRYLRRGVDEDGHVANYVETEMVGTI